jgi:hypothetical protein
VIFLFADDTAENGIGSICLDTIYEYSVFSAGADVKDTMSGRIGITKDCVRVVPFALVAVNAYAVPDSFTTVGVPSRRTLYLKSGLVPDVTIDESESPGGKDGATIDVIGLPDAKYVAAVKVTFLYPRSSVAYNDGIVTVLNRTVSPNEKVSSELPDTLMPPPCC